MTPSGMFQESFSTLREFKRLIEQENPDQELQKPEILRSIFFDEKLSGMPMAATIELVTLMRNLGSGMCDEQERIFSKACSEELNRAFAGIGWLEGSVWTGGMQQMFTDLPGPQLVADLLLGVYGFPYHPNCEYHKRWQYTAQETRMYLDSFVLDQARYFYDFTPNLPLFANEFSGNTGRQLVLRVCMDLIQKHCAGFGVDLFKLATLVSCQRGGCKFFNLPERAEILCD